MMNDGTARMANGGAQDENRDMSALKALAVLYVEDDDDIREELARFLRRRVGVLHTAVNGQEGLDLFRAERPDLVITDIMMPVMDGLAMTAAIKAINFDVPVVVTTAFNEHELLLQAIDAGVDKYVLKPINPEALSTALYQAAQPVFQRREIAARDEKLRLSARVFEATAEGIMITDAQGRILTVNRAFSQITGYEETEVLGQTPRILNSGRQDSGFYRQMWDSLRNLGVWQGEIWNRRKNGEVYPQWMTLSAAYAEDRMPSHYVAVFSDITQRKFDEERIAYLAHYDPLTDLPNRVLLMDRLAQAIAATQRQGHKAAILMLDLDRFKNINESLGHTFGDQLLQQVAQRVKGSVREQDTVARLGGDEYVLMLSDLQDPQEAALAAQKLVQSLAEPFSVNNMEIVITGSIGISLFPDDGEDGSSLMKNAEAAMYGAKQAGRNTYRFYTQNMNASTLNLVKLENALHHALNRGEFVLYYQPQVELNEGRVIGMEALLRWQHPEMGLVPPGDFIPLAEESGLIIPIGEWVLREACRQTKAWHDAGFPHLFVAVNLSAVQFKHPGLRDSVEEAVRSTGLTPRSLELELTESLVMHNAEKMIALLESLKALDLTLSIDDFGTGYSNMSYLKRFPVDKLKIDRSFVRDICEDNTDLAISQAIIALGHSLGLKIIAEGVEAACQLDLLRRNRCDEMQGFYFSKPVPAADFATLLQEGRHLEMPGG